MKIRTRTKIIKAVAIILLFLSLALTLISFAANMLLLTPIIFVTMFAYSEMKEWYMKSLDQELNELLDDINGSDIYL